MAHIPKRAAQHGLFLSGAEVTPVSLKPGQTQLLRQDFYTAEAKPLKDTYMKAEEVKESVYGKTIGNITLPEDYADPQKPMKPKAVGQGKPCSTAHWSSEYKSTFTPDSIDGATHSRQVGPPFKAPNQPTCVSQPADFSSYSKEYGVYGSDPRNRFVPGDTTRMHLKTELDVGTTKGTKHIPGYQGFLATNTRTPEVAAAEMGLAIRSVDKTNLTETYHQNVPGYSGHNPDSAKNDRGGRQPTQLTISGRDYKNPVKLVM